MDNKSLKKKGNLKLDGISTVKWTVEGLSDFYYLCYKIYISHSSSPRANASRLCYLNQINESINEGKEKKFHVVSSLIENMIKYSLLCNHTSLR